MNYHSHVQRTSCRVEIRWGGFDQTVVCVCVCECCLRNTWELALSQKTHRHICRTIGAHKNTIVVPACPRYGTENSGVGTTVKSAWFWGIGQKRENLPTRLVWAQPIILKAKSIKGWCHTSSRQRRDTHMHMPTVANRKYDVQFGT